MNIVTIQLAQLDVADRLRELDPDYVALLAAAIGTDGLRTPIEVRQDVGTDRYTLVSGAHRVAAMRAAGLTEASASLLNVDDLTARRLEIEENLIRHELTELDRSVFLARWKELYEVLNPASRHGGKRRKDQVSQIGHLNSVLFGAAEAGAAAPRFTTIAADKFRASERSMRRSVLRFKRIAPDVRQRITGTWLASKGKELDALCILKPVVQREVVSLLLTPIGDRDTQASNARTVKAMAQHVMGIAEPATDADQVQFIALLRLWRKTGGNARHLFMAELNKDVSFTVIKGGAQ